MKAVEVALVFVPDALDQCLRRDALCVSAQHDRCAVCVVRADVMHLVALHALNGFLLYKLFGHLFDRRSAIFAGVIFVMSPAQGEAVLGVTLPDAGAADSEYRDWPAEPGDSQTPLKA